MKKSNLFKLVCATILVSSLFVSCKKVKHKHLIAEKWVAETPIKYLFSDGGQNLGVGSTSLEWEILEMDFTDGQDRFPNGYFGTKATMKLNSYTSGNVTTGNFEWGFWEYVEYPGKENKFKEYDDFYKIPEEWKAEKAVYGELWNKSGSVRFYVFGLSKKKLRVAFEHIQSFNSGTVNRFYSPILTFVKD